jgi:hypothetical protein
VKIKKIKRVREASSPAGAGGARGFLPAGLGLAREPDEQFVYPVLCQRVRAFSLADEMKTAAGTGELKYVGMNETVVDYVIRAADTFRRGRCQESGRAASRAYQPDGHG